MTTNTNAALVEYANPLNWDVDENGIRRVWKEPGSETPEAYNGFELAKAALSTAAAVPAIPDAITHTIQRALVKFSDSELERLRTLLEPENAAGAMFGMARIAAQQNIDDADAALNWLAAAPKAAPAAPASQDAEDAARYRYLKSIAVQTADPRGPIFSIVIRRIDQDGVWGNVSATIDAHIAAKQEHKP